MGTNNLNRENLEKIFSGVPKEKLENAVKKAEILSKNPEVRNSFSKISDAQIRSMLSALNDGDKRKIISMINNSGNKEIMDLIKTLNGSSKK